MRRAVAETAGVHLILAVDLYRTIDIHTRINRVHL